ncbi:MAG: hypothetical protein WCP79_06890 [Bacillota bacterium]
MINDYNITDEIAAEKRDKTKHSFMYERRLRNVYHDDNYTAKEAQVIAINALNQLKRSADVREIIIRVATDGIVNIWML